MTSRAIIFVVGSLGIGGTERHLTQVLPRLDRTRWRPLVYCLTERGILAGELESAGIPVLCSPINNSSLSVSRARRALRVGRSILKLTAVMHEVNPAIAHFFLPASYILGAPAAFLARIPIRVMSRRSLNEYQRGRPVATWVESKLHHSMTAILGNSRHVVEQLRDEEKVPSEKLGLIYNGIDLGPYRAPGRREQTRASLELAADAMTFIIVANLIPYKGHRDLLAAFAMASKGLPDGWRLLIVGRDDGIQESLLAQAQELGIAAHVRFLGQRQDIPDLLRCTDISLLSSHQEGFSNSVLEAMAAGIPSIVTNVGGNTEAIADGETGIVVPARDPERLAAAIEKLATDEALRLRMGRKARVIVEEKFDLATCVARYECLYDGLIAGRQPAEIDGIRIT